MLARTVVPVSALALLGYLPAANPLTAPSRRERPPGILRSKIVVLYSHFQQKMSHPPGGGYAAILPLRLELPGESLAEHCGAKAPTGGFAAQILPPSPHYTRAG